MTTCVLISHNQIKDMVFCSWSYTCWFVYSTDRLLNTSDDRFETLIILHYFVGVKLAYKGCQTIHSIGGLAVVAFWRSPHGPLGSGPPRAGYSQRRKRKEKGERAALVFCHRRFGNPVRPWFTDSTSVIIPSRLWCFDQMAWPIIVSQLWAMSKQVSSNDDIMVSMVNIWYGRKVWV